MTYGGFLAYIDKHVLPDREAYSITLWEEPCNITPTSQDGCYGRVICSEKSATELWLTPDENDCISVNIGYDKLINHIKAPGVYVEQNGDTFRLYSKDLLEKFNPIIINISKSKLMKNSIRYIIARRHNGEGIGWLSSGPNPSKAFNTLADNIEECGGCSSVAVTKYAEYVEKNVNIGKGEIISACNAIIAAINEGDCIFEIEGIDGKETTKKQPLPPSANHTQLPFSSGDIVELVEYDGRIMSDYTGETHVGDKYRVLPNANDPEKVRLTKRGTVVCADINAGETVSISPLCLKLSMKLDDYNSLSRVFSYAFVELLTDLEDVCSAIKSGHFTEQDVQAIVSEAVKSIK